MSTHTVNVVMIEEVLPHPNADKLEIVPVNGWRAVVRKGDFKPGDKAIYIEPDYVVDTNRPEFAFLKKHGKQFHRLKAVRLRGELSFGLLIPMPSDCDFEVGANCMELFGITRYEPPVKYLHSEELPGEEHPGLYVPKFDIESYQKYGQLIPEGTDVVVTEKIHGANAKYLFHNDKLYMGSRSRWIQPDVDSVWKAALTEEMLQWLTANPDTILFGEVFGKTQSLRYGRGNNVDFCGFAALHKDKWINQMDLFESLNSFFVPHVPVLAHGGFRIDKIREMAERDSYVNGAPKGHMMEGVVITPTVERPGPSAGRLALKLISNRYWESNEE